MSELQPGTVVSERYRIIRLIGAGSVGTVFEVEHVDIGARFAMKVLAQHLVGVAGVCQRFVREARLSATLDDPRIARVTDFGRAGERPYLIMELLQGRTLGAAVRSGDLDAEAIIVLVIQALEGLAVAHARGIVHRDLKPDNLFVVEREDRREIKVLDLGIAKVAEPSDELRTTEGAVFGTPRYMAPEQASGEPVDPRTDLYAVGVLLYEALSGEPPFTGTSAAEVLRKHIVEPPPRLERIAIPAPETLDRASLADIIAETLNKEPHARPSSAEALAEKLRSVLRSGAAIGSRKPRTPRATSPARRRSTVVVPVRAGLAGLAGAGLVVGLLSSMPPGAPEAPPVELPRPQSLDPGSPRRTSTEVEPLVHPNMVVAPSPEPGRPRSERDAGLEHGAAPSEVQSWAAAAANGEIEAAQEKLRTWLTAGMTLERDAALMGLLRAWSEERMKVGLARLIETFESAARTTPEADELGAERYLLELARAAPTFALRRQAYEALERLDATAELEPVSYLSSELRKNGTQSCRLRRWYVERIARYQDPSTIPLLIAERERRGGFLGLERKGGCLDPVVNPSLKAMRQQEER